MEYTEFNQWLIDNKKMSVRSAHDVISRLRRVTKILGTKEISIDDSANLAANNEFLLCSLFIKSQLKRAITLYLEYSEN